MLNSVSLLFNLRERVEGRLLVLDLEMMLNIKFEKLAMNVYEYKIDNLLDLVVMEDKIILSSFKYNFGRLIDSLRIPIVHILGFRNIGYELETNLYQHISPYVDIMKNNLNYVIFNNKKSSIFYSEVIPSKI